MMYFIDLAIGERNKKLIPVIQKAIHNTFDMGDWKSLGYAVGETDYINNHSRLLRSLQWGDPDYDGCIFDAVEHILKVNQDNMNVLLQNDKIKEWIKNNDPGVYQEFYNDSSYVPSFRPKSQVPREVVEQALKDAEILIHSSGPVSAVDRVHTALHGYMISICDKHSISYSKDAGINELYKSIRKNVPELKQAGEQSAEINKILRSLASVMDALNTLRNKASVAHPTESLLGEEEAILAINISRTLLHYLEAKV